MKSVGLLFVLGAFAVSLAVSPPLVKGQAQRQESTFRIEFSEQNPLEVYNTCPGGENAIMNKGYLEWSTSELQNDGGISRFVSKFRMDASGFGTSTKRLMHLSDVENFNYGGNSEGFRYQSVGKFTLNTQGQGGDQRGKFQYVVTWDPEKGYQYFHSDFRAVCN